MQTTLQKKANTRIWRGVNLIVPGDNGRRKERKKKKKEIIFNSDTINMAPSQWSLLIPMQGSLQG